ncbi:protease [Alkalihalobacillus alcalophilus ATCC 27647 = CGMCC 1.3604]|uniref:Sporulation sigma-E factor-processing peptidase n=1 Tax=Alkalihalobacillus alcalophilus ATCC 27647 = CGMCC 1.3604 TaxID=1218173 RepID=A0A094XDY5_ALKAL|nr:sigma-E processing peptidase SpoIIGA [Alkalihalobacillus alcalophilus]KGA97005.1 protease [Alkalihalobacillus alcalophilus ATCC 27647 = CGMCC 1.3604]MED1563118.1 sigma-E processing peptidase SpoIIGA [Alkalihalobacillus alcalophilus]THG92222.1 protease [Alkalihalobacillus alcalophilus ATCC 27647 = CGMCC 1.3604]
MTVYLDLIWLLNFFIDYLLIALTALVLKRRFKHVRFILAAFIASFIVILMFTPFADLVYSPWFKLIYSALIVWVAFGYERLRFFIQNLLMFYFVTFMTGGALFALHFFWQTELDILSSFSPQNGIFIGSSISWVFVLIGFPLVWYFSKQRFETIETKKIQADQMAEVTLFIDHFEIKTIGLVDTGNQLLCPITKQPVMIIEGSLLYETYSEAVVKELSQIAEGKDELLPETEKLAHRVRIIPYRVVGQASPFLTALKPDKVEIVFNNERYETEKVLLGLQEGELSADGLFTSIIHPKLVQGPVLEKLA